MKNKIKKTLSVLSSIFIISSGLAACQNDQGEPINSSTSITEVTTDEPTTLSETTSLPIITTTEVETTKVVTQPVVTEAQTTVKPKEEYASNSLVTCSDVNFQMSVVLNQRLTNTINSMGKTDIAFQVLDLATNTTFNYNLNGKFNGACIVKPSVVLYLLKLAEVGKIDLNEIIPYPGNVVSGSGYLNGFYNGYQARTGQKFSVYEYMYHALYYSDNNAYRILWKKLINSGYYEQYKAYMEEIGAESLTVSKDIMWVRGAQADDGVNIMKAIYEYKDSSSGNVNIDYQFVDGHNLADMAKRDVVTYGELLYWIMANGEYDYIENKTGNFSVSKTGFVSGNGPYSSRNLIAISYGERTYIICILTKFHDESTRKAAMNYAIVETYELIKEYDAYLKNQNTLQKSN